MNIECSEVLTSKIYSAPYTKKQEHGILENYITMASGCLIINVRCLQPCMEALGLFSLRKRRLQGDLIVTFQHLNRATEKKGTDSVARSVVIEQGEIVSVLKIVDLG